MHPFLSVDITPNYALGFSFYWTLSNGFSDPNPLSWTFTVERGYSPTGPWEALSPALGNVRFWAQSTDPVNPEQLRLNKDRILHYRIVLTTPVKTYYSDVRMPYGDVSRYDYLILREIMRQELLRMRLMSGVRCAYWSEAVYGSPCPVCRHPVSGDSLREDCDACYGTGVLPGYYGPYDVWCSFTPEKRDTEQTDNGTVQLRSLVVRMIGYPYSKHGDIIVDLESNKRYHIDGVETLMEVRRIGAIQQALANELPLSDPIYRLGTGVPGDSCVVNQA